MISSFLFLTAIGISSQTFKDVEYDPNVAGIIQSVSEDSVSALIGGLSGERSVTIGGEKDSLPLRSAYSPDCYRVALWLRAELENCGVGTELRSFIPLEFSDAALLPSGAGWACVRNSAAPNNIYHTEDAGVSWQPEGKFNNLWEDIELVDNGSCFAVSSAGRLARNLDGSSWEFLSIPKGAYAISFVDSVHGWAVGDSGMVLRTSNAGESWSEERISTEGLRKVDFASLNNGWAASDKGLWTSDDGGLTWTYLNHPPKRITDIELRDSLRGWLAGVTNEDLGAVFASEDGGFHWEALLDTLSLVPKAIDVVSLDTLCVAGEGGMILVSFDSGVHWQARVSSTRGTITSIDFARDGRGLAVGPEEILYSPDGESWVRPDTTSLGLMWNVIGAVPGSDSTLVILTAHYDARSEDSTYTPGADDNASGVACVLEAARVLKDHTFKHSLRFICFAGEEVGLLGSHRYVTELLGARQDIFAVLNADMIAYDSNADRRMEVNANEQDPLSPAAAKILLEVIDVYDLGLDPSFRVRDAKQNSDHYYFWQNLIPAVSLHEDRDDFNPFYHKTGDRLLNLDLGYLTENVRSAVGWAAVVADADSLVDVCEKPEGPDETLSLQIRSPIVTHQVLLEIAASYGVTPVVYDVAGRKVKTFSAIPSSSAPMKVTLDVSDLAGGVYWVSMAGSRAVVSERFVIVR